MSAAASGAVLVTGASTGIGEATVELLAARGVPVIAGARGAADLERLGAMAGVEALQLDVTDPGHVDELRTRLPARRSAGSSTTRASRSPARSRRCRSTSCAASSRSTSSVRSP